MTRWKAVTLILALLAGLPLEAGCRSSRQYVPPVREEPELRRLTIKDNQTGQLLRAWTVMIFPDGRQQKHGPDKHWYPNGARLSEGRF